MQRAAKSQWGDKAVRYRERTPTEEPFFPQYLSTKGTVMVLCALEYNLQCCRSVLCSKIYYSSCSSCRFTAVARGCEFSLVVNDNLGIQKNVSDDGLGEPPDTILFPCLLSAIFLPIFPSPCLWESKRPLLKHTLPIPIPLYCQPWPQLDPVIHNPVGLSVKMTKGSRGNLCRISEVQKITCIVAKEERACLYRQTHAGTIMTSKC